MTSEKWTPGEWRVIKGKRLIRIVAPDLTTLATVFPLAAPPRSLLGKFNAPLMAAAPEYYELVEFLYGLLTKELACPDVLTTTELVDACTRIEVLQAKARGEVTPVTPAPDGAETGSEAKKGVSGE